MHQDDKDRVLPSSASMYNILPVAEVPPDCYREDQTLTVWKRPIKAKESYTGGWICAIATEFVAAQKFLDEEPTF